MTIIEAIYSEFVDYAHRSKKQQEEYQPLAEAYCNALDEYMITLTPEQKAAVIKLESQRNLLAAMDEELMFCYGFRVGAQLILDILRPNS